MKSTPQADILRRLRCAAGHLNAVIEMAESNKPCDQVLHQLKAVEAAVHIISAKVMMYQAESIQAAILKTPSPKERMAELGRLRSLYKTFMKYTDHLSEVPHD